MEKLLLKIGFDKSEAQFFSRTFFGMDVEDKALLERLGTDFSSGKGIEIYKEVQESLKPLAVKYNLDTKTVDMLFFLCNLEKMRDNFIKNGIDEQLFFDTAKDFKYKLDECKKIHGILGVRTFRWYYRFFNAEIVALGRFQYHKLNFFEGMTYKWKDITITPEDTIINFHIPSSGPMTREMRLESYKKAFEYFGKTKGEYIVIVCMSWLIYPGYREVFPEGSNLYDFLDDFDIVHIDYGEQNQFLNSWQVFGKEYNGSTEKLPADTTLQRNFIKFLDEGKLTGWGTGVILFDGEKIVNKKGF